MSNYLSSLSLNRKILKSTILISLPSLIFLLMFFVMKFNVYNKTNAFINCIVYSIILVLNYIYICYYNYNTNFKDNYRNKIFDHILVSVFLGCFFSACVIIFDGSSIHKINIYILKMLSEIFTALPVFLFVYYTLTFLKINKMQKKVFRILTDIFVFISFLFIVSAYFNHMLFYVNENNKIILNDSIITIFYDLWFIVILILFILSKNNANKISLFSYTLFWIAAGAFEILVKKIFGDINVDCAYGIAALLSIIISIENIYMYQQKILLIKEKELSDTKLQAMMLQINPHFIYNTLGSIVGLCDYDAQEAKKLTIKFSNYLRDNYSNLTSTPLIPFWQELQNLKHYLSIEQVRFPNLIVEYDIMIDNFYVPTLTVQPLVENAVRHGIQKRRKSAGTIKISSYETKDKYIIRIEDNGVGFSEMPNDGKPHIGIKNTEMRLNILCNGTLTVKSKLNEGTTSEITIPKEKDV